MKIIGLTGGIGSGKSTVLKLFQNLGVAIYVADIEAKKLMNTNDELIDQIINLLGEKAYLNKKLNKEFIASVIFKDKSKLEELNKLVHPKVRNHFKDFLKTVKEDIVMYEAAILFESGGHSICDYIVTVTASYSNKIQRVIKRDNVSKEQIEERMKNQLNDDYKIKNADFVIVNNTLSYTEFQVLTIFELIKSEFKN